MKTLNYRIDHGKEKLITFGITCVIMIVCLISVVECLYISYVLMVHKEYIVKFVTKQILLLIEVSGHLEVFNLYCFFILHRLYELNDCFKFLFKTSDLPSKKMLRMAIRRGNLDLRKAVKIFEEAYEQLVQITDEVNQYLANGAMYTIWGFILVMLLAGFSVYRVLYEPELEGYFLLMIIFMMIALYLSVFIIVALVICSLISKTGQDSAVMVHNAINFLEDDAVIDEV